MDKNKLQILKEINYKVSKCCAICKHSIFPSKLAIFGTCAIIKYSHLKHTDSLRQLSICKYGGCENKFEIDENISRILCHYSEFIK